MLNGLDLFSGIGGISLALEPWIKPVAYCENDRYAQSVLLSRMRDGRLHHAPIWDDVRTLNVGIFPSRFPIDIIFGGFPCQDISVAGVGKGLDGSRSGLFFEIIRLTRELRPRFVFLENVPAITVRGLDRVLLEFTALGYDCRWTIVSAAEMGAPHLRERWFLLAHANDERRGHKPDEQPRSDGRTVARLHGQAHLNTASAGLERWLDAKEAWKAFALGSGSGSGKWPHWLPQPSLCRGAHGLSYRVERLRGLGNAVVPLQAREAFERLMGLK